MKFEDAAMAFDRFGFDWGYLISYRFHEDIIRGEGYKYKRVIKPETAYPFFVIPWMQGEDDPWVAVFPAGKDLPPYQWEKFLDASGEFNPPIPTQRVSGDLIYTDWPKTPAGKRRHFQMLPMSPRIWDNEGDWASAVHHEGKWYIARTLKEARAIAKELGQKAMW
jgi:hypothetical protein